MSNETKRDVFEKALRAWDDLVHSCGLQGEESHGGCEFDPILIKYRKGYDAALPDNLPVIPEDVSEWLTWCKRSNHSLKDGLDCETRVSEDDFARAWVLGAWKVEETGEVVKL